MTGVLNLQATLHGREKALLNRYGCGCAEEARRICARGMQNIADSLAI